MHKLFIYTLCGLVLSSYQVQSQTSSYAYHESNENWVRVDLKENNRFVKYSRNKKEGSIKSFGYYQDIGDSLILFHEPTDAGLNVFEYEIQERKYLCNVEDSLRKVVIQIRDLEYESLPQVPFKLMKGNLEVFRSSTNDKGKVSFSFNPFLIDRMNIFYLGYESVEMPLSAELPPCSDINVTLAYEPCCDGWARNYNYFIEKGVYTNSNKSGLDLGNQTLNREEKKD